MAKLTQLQEFWEECCILHVMLYPQNKRWNAANVANMLTLLLLICCLHQSSCCLTDAFQSRLITGWHSWMVTNTHLCPLKWFCDNEAVKCEINELQVMLFIKYKTYETGSVFTLWFFRIGFVAFGCFPLVYLNTSQYTALLKMVRKWLMNEHNCE